MSVVVSAMSSGCEGIGEVGGSQILLLYVCLVSRLCTISLSEF